MIKSDKKCFKNSNVISSIILKIKLKMKTFTLTMISTVATVQAIIIQDGLWSGNDWV